jgi:hypothetical protein
MEIPDPAAKLIFDFRSLVGLLLDLNHRPHPYQLSTVPIVRIGEEW